MKPFLETVRERVVIYDGAMGTEIQERHPSMDDFWGKENCSEVLVLSRPDIIKDIHAAYFKAGADVVETNTFGGTRIVLGEFDLADKVHEINKRAAELAREVARDFSANGKPRYVAGSIGPGTKLPSLGQISYDDMFNAYLEQSLGLIDGGVDILLIETCQDILQTKVSVAAAFEAMKQRGKRIPVQAQVTLQESGTMLLGTEIGAAETALEPFDCEIIGLNCATGPKEMNDAVRYLAHNAPKEISILPNAGLPENVGGVAHYRLTPQIAWRSGTRSSLRNMAFALWADVAAPRRSTSRRWLICARTWNRRNAKCRSRLPLQVRTQRFRLILIPSR